MTDNCLLVYEGYDPARERLREALTTLGNGYFATRGAAPEADADDVHYPGTYLAGGYNRLTSEIGGEQVENEDLVNLPNWLPLSVRIDGGEWLRLTAVELLAYRQELDMARGLLTRNLQFRDRQGRITRLVERRLVHMREPHLAALETTVTAENWSGLLDVRSALDGRVVNDGVARYRGLANRHLATREAYAYDDDGLYLRVETVQSRLQVALAARTRLYRASGQLDIKPRAIVETDYLAHEYAVRVTEGETITVEKIVSLYSSRDAAVAECGLAARGASRHAASFAELAASQALAWEQLWRRFYIDVEHVDGVIGNHTAMVLRLHIFHLLQTASPNTIELDAGIPARGLHGEAYRGHIFWDELFILPLFNLRLPAITRALLLYRHRRLGAARELARAAGLNGALYPWQSGSSGREESQRRHLNPVSGRWIPDRTHLQRHVNAAIAYNVWQYYQATRDTQFLAHYGAEMIVEIARLWSSLATRHRELDRYEIRGVMGPDEYHDAYPDAREPGLDNNAYTNLMAVWVLCRALELEQELGAARHAELCERLSVTREEIDGWNEISRKMRLVFHDDGIISQFEGYDRLAELDWDGYRKKYADIQRLDRLLEAEGDTTNRYKVSKQADVLMLFYLFSSEELRELFERLGYPFEYETIPRNIEYYLARTSHGSSLSRVVHSWVQARADRKQLWKLFTEALASDVADIQGGTTAEGVHLGAMAGTVDLLQRVYSGVETRGDALRFNPCLPAELSALAFNMHYRGQRLRVRIERHTLIITAAAVPVAPISLTVGDEQFTLPAGETLRVSF